MFREPALARSQTVGARKTLWSTAKGTRLSRAQALKTFFLFPELRHKAEFHQMTGRDRRVPDR